MLETPGALFSLFPIVEEGKSPVRVIERRQVETALNHRTLSSLQRARWGFSKDPDCRLKYHTQGASEAFAIVV